MTMGGEEGGMDAKRARICGGGDEEKAKEKGGGGGEVEGECLSFFPLNPSSHLVLRPALLFLTSLALKVRAATVSTRT